MTGEAPNQKLEAAMIRWYIGCAGSELGEEVDRIPAANAISVLFHELGHTHQRLLSKEEIDSLSYPERLERETDAWARGKEMIEAFFRKPSWQPPIQSDFWKAFAIEKAKGLKPNA